MEKMIYAAACVLIPLVWGLLVARLFDRLEALLERRKRKEEPSDAPRKWREEIEYYI